MIAERGTPTYTKKKGIASRVAVVPNKDGAEDKILLLEERIHEVVCKTNNEGPREKHPDKIRGP